MKTEQQIRAKMAESEHLRSTVPAWQFARLATLTCQVVVLRWVLEDES